MGILFFIFKTQTNIYVFLEFNSKLVRIIKENNKKEYRIIGEIGSTAHFYCMFNFKSNNLQFQMKAELFSKFFVCNSTLHPP